MQQVGQDSAVGDIGRRRHHGVDDLWSGCRRPDVLPCRSTTDCPSWSDACPDRVPCSAFLVEDGALMIVASTIVPRATFSPLASRCRCTSSKIRLPRSCCSSKCRKRHTVVSSGTGWPTQIDADKASHRRQIIERFLDCRVGQVEPLLQEVDAQHPFDPDRRTAVAGLRIIRRHLSGTAPTTAPPCPSPTETPARRVVCRNARTRSLPKSSASSPPTLARQSTRQALYQDGGSPIGIEPVRCRIRLHGVILCAMSRGRGAPPRPRKLIPVAPSMA